MPALAYLTPEAGAEVTRPQCKRSACWDLAHAREDMGKGSTVLAGHIPDLLAHRAHACCVLSRLSHVESPYLPTSIYKSVLLMESSAEIEKDAQL